MECVWARGASQTSWDPYRTPSHGFSAAAELLLRKYQCKQNRQIAIKGLRFLNDDFVEQRRASDVNFINFLKYA